jgi:hypothetical protein
MTLSARYEILRVETEVVGGANAPRHAGEQTRDAVGSSFDRRRPHRFDCRIDVSGW